METLIQQQQAAAARWIELNRLYEHDTQCVDMSDLVDASIALSHANDALEEARALGAVATTF